MGCARYIELNPVRAGMVKEAGHYRWSSYMHYASGARNVLLDDNPCYEGLGDLLIERQKGYREFFDANGPYSAMIDKELIGGYF